jgi:glycosyltransferase involved in cell wall biosynthesis
MQPIVFQALPKWDGSYNSTALSISKGLSKDRLVFYVEHPFSLADRFRRFKKDQLKRRTAGGWECPFPDHPNFVVIHPPLTMPINALQEGWLYRKLLQSYITKLWNKIDAILDQFGIDTFAYINSFDPVYFDIQSRKTCSYRVYHCVDLIEGESYIGRHGVEAEKKAAAQADCVITTSEPLKQRLIVHNSESICIPNAADFRHFAAQQLMPKEYASLYRKKIVYTGNIGLRIDYEALENIADTFPDHDLILIGPKDERYFNGQNLGQKPNVHFLGPRKYHELPAYLHHADILLIPFECNDLTHHIYPLKLNEYFATAKPVVSSNFTHFGDFEAYMHIYKDHSGMVEAIEAADREIDPNVRTERIRLSSRNTWDHRLADWKQILTELEAKRLSTSA